MELKELLSQTLSHMADSDRTDYGAWLRGTHPKNILADLRDAVEFSHYSDEELMAGITAEVDANPVNLMNKYKLKGWEQEFRDKFAAWRKDRFVGDANSKHDLKTGDQILFLNGYDIPMISEILGFDEEGKAYMLWDCYWFAVDLDSRLIKKIQ